MKEALKNYIKPTLGKVILAFVFVGWQYFYSYQSVRLDFLAPYAGYVTSALSAIDWNNYFVRNFSLFFLWVLLAFIIFFIIWAVEVISISLYNHRISRNHRNKPIADYESLLRTRIKFFEHLKSRSLWVAGIMIILISLFALSDLFERLRFSLLDAVIWNMVEGGALIDIYDPVFTISSFVAMAFLWYLVSAFIVFIFIEQKEKLEEEEISEEHFAIPVDTKEKEE